MMHSIAWLLAAFPLASSAAASNNDEIMLFPGGAPNETHGFPGPESRESNDGKGCGANHSTLCDHIYNVSAPTLTPFIVNNAYGAAVIIAPGGGYRDLAWTKEGLDVARMYNSLGVSAFVLKYRVPARPDIEGLPKWWAPLQDAQRAMSLVRTNAKKWGLNASRIGFTGFSAGGHLTAHVSGAWAQRSYARLDSIDATSSRPDFSLLMYPWMLLENNKKTQPWSLGKELNVTKEHPPSFFCQNEDDNTAPVQGSIAYYLELLHVKAPMSSLHVSPAGGHGFALCQGVAHRGEICAWPQAARRFLLDQGVVPEETVKYDSDSMLV